MVSVIIQGKGRGTVSYLVVSSTIITLSDAQRDSLAIKVCDRAQEARKIQGPAFTLIEQFKI
jgi:hypothetical protein